MITDVPEGWIEAPVNPTDLGASRDERAPKPCCARHRLGWCLLPIGHVGDHHAVGPNECPLPQDYGPKRAQTGAKK